MMKFASIILLSTLIMLSVQEIKNLQVSQQDQIVFCLKLKKQLPNLNLDCEDLIVKPQNGQMASVELSHERTNISTPDNTTVFTDQDENEIEIRIEGLENKISQLAGNLRKINEEITRLKDDLKMKRRQKVTSQDTELLKNSVENANESILNVQKSDQKVKYDHNQLKKIMTELSAQDFKHRVKKVSKSDEEKLHALINQLKQK